MPISLDPLPMQEAQSFWRDKVKLGPGEFAKLSSEAKVKAFAVSGIAKGAELDTVFTALQRAIDDGISFGEFKKQCAEIIERRGWTGKRAWRVDNIFRTNIQTAYNVGHYKQLMDDGDLFPYWQYSAVNDARTRPTHLAMNGRCWPKDHPVWDIWYPPNGYRCRCSVIGITQMQANRGEVKIESDDPTNGLIEPIDFGTGNRMPAVQLLPDPGFAHNPGKVVYGGMADSADKGAQMFRSLENLRGPEHYRRPSLAHVRPSSIPDLEESMLLPAGLSDNEYRNNFISRYGEEQVLEDAIGDPVILSLRAYQVYKGGNQPQVWKFTKTGHGESIPLLGQVLEDPYEIWLNPQKNPAGKIRLAKRYIGLWKTADRKRVAGLVVFEVVDGVWQGVTGYVPMSRGTTDLEYANRQRSGLLLYSR